MAVKKSREVDSPKCHPQVVEINNQSSELTSLLRIKKIKKKKKTYNI